ncbi:MAG TPA: tripartite tricarboxylate transporter substrate-binding protein [Stellaceae bacterium]|jgi:tripartite-type tricarboxylate transporter receptor subunit TctC|nr:tripartite tricarboxylate transporter substrate-binding protein [Stellaceae bacterium]
MRMTSFSGRCVALALAASLQFVPGTAQAANPNFYAGKTISLVIGSGEGGIYDLGGRLMARFLEKYIPGHPTIVARNMPGASSVVATQFVYNSAPPDGLTIATVQPTVVLNKLLDPSAKYVSEKLSWIGRVQPVTLVGLSWTASGVTNIRQAETQQVIVSASGATGTSAIVPWALNKLVGTRFKVVRGYVSQAPQFVAMERGEVAGIGSASLSDVLEKADWTAQKKVTILYTIAQHRSSLAPNAPALTELAKTDQDKKVLALLGSVSDVGQTLMAPPGVPKDRLDILRKAFDAMVKDPDFAAGGKVFNMGVDPLKGADLAALVSDASNAPAPVVERLRAVTRPQ